MRSRSGRVWLWLAVLTLALAAGLRFTRISHQSLSLDEGLSAARAIMPATEIVRDSAQGGDLPGYPLLLAGWQHLAGSSELALRMLSALAGVISVALVFALGVRLFDRPTGTLAALFVAANPFQVWYGQEAHLPALLGMLSAASVLLTIAVLAIPRDMPRGRFDPRRAALVIGAYVLVNAGGLYTHATFALIILIETLVFLLWLANRPRKFHGLVTWALIQVGTLALFAPWLPVAVRQVTAWLRAPAEGVTLPQLGGTVAYGLTVPPGAVSSGLVPLLLLALVGLFPPMGEERRSLRFEERIALLAAWLLLPVAVPVALGAVAEPYLKFLLPSGLALQLLVARGLAMGVRISAPVPGGGPLGGQFTRVVVAILLAVGLLPVIAGLQNLYTDPEYARDDYRGVAARIIAEAGPQAAVVLNPPEQAAAFTYYYPAGPGVASLPGAHTAQTLERLLASHDRVYAIYNGREGSAGQEIERLLDERASVAGSDWYGRVRLVTYDVRREGSGP